MIEDKELRELFRAESGERLQRLDDGLLQLEKSPLDPALLEELFREAHSLKGAARMMGLNEIQTLAHQLEDTLGVAKKGGATPQPEVLAAMSRTLEAIRKLVKSALGEAAPDKQPLPTQPAPLPAGAEAEAPAAAPPPSSDKAESFRIETIRVDPKRLDALLSQAGELTVTKTRIARRLTDIDKLLDFCDEWRRTIHSAHYPRDAARAQTVRLEPLREMLTRLRASAYEATTRLDLVADNLDNGIRTLRLLPMTTLFMLFPRLVHDLAREQQKEVELVIEGAEAVADKRVLEEMKDPLMHILRNAIDHGIEEPAQREQAGKPRIATIRLKASQTPDSLIIEVSDDGRGLDLDAIRRTAVSRSLHSEQELAAMSEAQIESLVLAPGFSTRGFITDVSGRGVGLDVVRKNVERLKGSIQLDSRPGEGLTVWAQLPVSLTTAGILLVTLRGHRYALPVEQVCATRKMPREAFYFMEGRQTVTIDDEPLSVARLDELLELDDAPPPPLRQSEACVIMTVAQERYLLLVDEVIDVQQAVLKPQGGLLKRVRNVSGATILDTGEVCMVLNPADLLKTLWGRSLRAPAASPATGEAPAKKVLLLAEDSITTRTQEKRILEGAGYEVVIAVDGADAFNKLGTRPFDAVISDIQMPNMNGLELTERIRAESRYADLPIILVTSLASKEDQQRGLDAGANAYIAKPEFNQQVLLESLSRLI